jgi:hypothetical protein
MIDVFVGFSRIFLLGILFFKGLIARRFYKSFGVKGLTNFLDRGHSVVFKRQYWNEIKYILRLSQLSFCFIISNVGK